MKNLLLSAVHVTLPLLLSGCGEKSTVEPVVEVKSVGASQTPGTFMYEQMNGLFQRYKLNAEKGDANAQFNLGYHYGEGEGVPRDYVVAYAWFHIAQINADDEEEAKGYEEWKDKLVTKMTSEQITKAKEISKEMVKKNPKLISEKP